jgi:pyruvate,orthophosphate dikinase
MSAATLVKTRWVYAFGGGRADGDASMKDLLGGKGANLAEMSSLGLPVPPGFTISTEACVHYYANESQYPADLQDQVAQALKTVESQLPRPSATRPTRCWSRCARARGPRCRG